MSDQEKEARAVAQTLKTAAELLGGVLPFITPDAPEGVRVSAALFAIAARTLKENLGAGVAQMLVNRYVNFIWGMPSADFAELLKISRDHNARVSREVARLNASVDAAVAALAKAQSKGMPS